MSSRGWCFTDFVGEDASSSSDAGNAPECWERDLVARFEAGPEDIRPQFWIAQLERSPSTQRLHFQGYAYFQRRVSLRGVRGLLCGAHWEPAKGSPQQNIAYCSKAESRAYPERSPTERGERPAQGQRSDLADVAKELLEGKTVEEVAVHHPGHYIRYHRGIQALRSIHLKQKGSVRRFQCFELFLGCPGIGKSSSVLVRWPQPVSYWARDTEEGWCDQYDGQRVFVLDEFRGRFPSQLLLPLLGDGPLLLPVKGGMVASLVDTVVATSNVGFGSLADRYGGAFERRCNDFGFFWFLENLVPAGLVRSPGVLRWEQGGRVWVPRGADQLEAYRVVVETPYGRRRWLRVPFRETHASF